MQKIRFVEDPGHGGKDKANRGPSGYIEADGVLDISKRVKQKVEDTGAFDVKLTRDKDATLGLTERAKIAIEFKADLFISQHTNAGGTGAAGTVVYYSVDLPESKVFAEELAKEISGALGIPNRGAKVRESDKYVGEDYYTVIDAAQDRGIKNVFLIESAFHSNPDEEKLLLDPEKRDAIAEAQAKVICKHYGIAYPAATTVEQPEKSAAPIGAEQPSKPSINSKVLELQHALNRLKIRDGKGNALAEDGILGSCTKEAVKRLQSICGLSVDGIAGTNTWNAINIILGKAVIKVGSKGIAVRYLQYRAGAAIDGIFGSNTKATVMNFQKKNGLSADGIVGPKTWSKLIG